MSSDSSNEDVPSQDLQAGDDQDRAAQRAEAAASPHEGDREHNGYAGVGVLGDSGVATPHHSQPSPLSQDTTELLAMLEAGRMSSPTDDGRTRRRLARELRHEEQEQAAAEQAAAEQRQEEEQEEEEDDEEEEEEEQEE